MRRVTTLATWDRMCDALAGAMRSTQTDWGFASELDDVGGEVAIVGIGDADYSKASGRTTHEIAAQATERALVDAGLRPSDIDGLMYVPFGRSVHRRRVSRPLRDVARALGLGEGRRHGVGRIGAVRRRARSPSARVGPPTC
jgi:hypothetical protein